MNDDEVRRSGSPIGQDNPARRETPQHAGGLSSERRSPTANDPTDGETVGVSRRGLVGGLAAGAGIIGAGAVGGLAARASATPGIRKESVVVEVACLAELWREAAKGNQADDADGRAAFVVEGWIYPAGTIKGDGFIPVEEGSIGRWFCRGFLLIDAARSEPHVNSAHDYIFGSIKPGNLFPPDTLSSSGLEGTDDRTQRAVRAVTGGTGMYMGAVGQVHQQVIAMNTSYFPDSTDPGFCWRFEFDLRVFD